VEVVEISRLVVLLVWLLSVSRVVVVLLLVDCVSV
jgi:hypothetical protein